MSFVWNVVIWNEDIVAKTSPLQNQNVIKVHLQIDDASNKIVACKNGAYFLAYNRIQAEFIRRKAWTLKVTIFDLLWIEFCLHFSISFTRKIHTDFSVNIF